MPTDPGSRKGRDRARPSDDAPGSRLRATPGARQAPAGLDRAKRRQDAPPRPSRQVRAPRRPDLPSDESAHLPPGARKEIDRVLGRGPRADDVALALSVGADAIDVGRVDVALEALTWAKHEASRVAVIREALGVARYLDEDYAGALTELQAYRRISGRVDQNHLVADSLRALGRDTDRVIEPLEELLADDRVADDRRAEAIIIWAATLADREDLEGARALLRRHLGRAGASQAASDDLRVHVLAADLADRAGDAESARAHRAIVAQAEPDLLEVAEDRHVGDRQDDQEDEVAQIAPDGATSGAGDPGPPTARPEPSPQPAGEDDPETSPERRTGHTGEQAQLPFDL